MMGDLRVFTGVTRKSDREVHEAFVAKAKVLEERTEGAMTAFVILCVSPDGSLHSTYHYGSNFFETMGAIESVKLRMDREADGE